MPSHPPPQSATRAVVLAGGKGARLRPFTTVLPKPLMPVGDQPILAIVLDRLRRSGVRHVTLSVGYLAELIRAVCGNGDRFGLDIDYVHEDRPLGTIGPLALIPALGETFLVMNGDVLTDLDPRDLLATHRRSGAELTIATYRRRLQVDFGVLSLSDHGDRVVGFTEKPLLEHDVSMGVYAMNASILRFVAAGEALGFDGLMARMLEAGAPIACHHHTGAWLDIGRHDDYDRAQSLVLTSLEEPPPDTSAIASAEPTP